MKGQFLPYKDENPLVNKPVVTFSLIAINLAVFLYSLLDFESIILAYGFTPAQFSPLTLLTSMFLHGGLTHIFGNMLFLYIYGDNVEDRFGKGKFILFYLGAGVFAGLVHFIFNPLSASPAIGASGAISGVLGAYLAMFPRVKIRAIGPFFFIYRLRASILIGFWFVFQLALGFFTILGGVPSGIAFFAHLGGFVFGYLVGRIYCKGVRDREPRSPLCHFRKPRIKMLPRQENA